MPRKTNRTPRLGRVLAALMLIVLFTSMILVTALVLYAEYGIDASLDLELLLDGQGRTTKLYYYNEDGEPTELTDERLHGAENRIYVPLSDIPKEVQNAFIAIEDHRFYLHRGIDLRRTAGAVLSFFLPKGRSYGGSTITQQLIKNLTGDNSVTVRRKLTEIMRALRLEKELPKEKILELYLNTVYLSEGCYGIETAAEKYFGKTAAELTTDEGATLAAILQYPTRYDPIVNPSDSRRRRDTVLYRMSELEMIDAATLDTLTAAPTVLHVTAPKKQEGKNSWFTETVIEDVIADLCGQYGISRTAASHMLYNGGLSVYTTMDQSLQHLTEVFYEDRENIPRNSEGGRATSAAVVIDPRNGHLLAVAGDTGEKNSDRIFNLATQMRRSPGSVIKPISVYAPALEEGLISWASVFDDVPVLFTKTGSGYTLWPKNNPRVYGGLTTVNTALMKSTNTVAVRILERLGADRSFAFCRSVGLHSLVESETAENGTVLSDMAPAPLALGATTKGTSVREITGAYTALADGGVFHKTVSYTAVYDKDGKLLLSNEEGGERVLSEETADIMTRMLQNVVTDGTAKGMGISRLVPVAGKTGTSNADTDRWFIGYTPSLLCGIWYGYKEARDVGKFNGNPAVLLFDGLMTKLYAGGADKITLDRTLPFPESENVESALFCIDSGDAPGSACRFDLRGHRVELGYFKKGTAPVSKCHTHILVDYDLQTGAVAAPYCPDGHLGKAALVKEYNRRFPCAVTVTDAQYIYRHLPFGAPMSAERSRAFFQDAYEEDCYIGSSRTDAPRNRSCHEHSMPPEETTPPDTPPSETTSPTTPPNEATSPSRSPAKTTAPATLPTKQPCPRALLLKQPSLQVPAPKQPHPQRLPTNPPPDTPPAEATVPANPPAENTALSLPKMILPSLSHPYPISLSSFSLCLLVPL